uniref:Endonuclease III homolog n=1 Tax=Palpitomonas bilix TaxID=652834 RepID=A0A7S3G4Y9_9EUKA|mmetsp:Transcript_26081/g.66191  ORF Transcript_26081/g.66191 Transcript_26081/m.66191 type:complete len:358 (+) Transcript_26081:225-1298(+)
MSKWRSPILFCCFGFRSSLPQSNQVGYEIDVAAQYSQKEEDKANVKEDRRSVEVSSTSSSSQNMGERRGGKRKTKEKEESDESNVVKREEGGMGAMPPSTPPRKRGKTPSASPKRSPLVPSRKWNIKPHPRWREILENIEKMREKNDAPVDKFGTEALPDASSSRDVFAFQALISAMLSAQTKDPVVAEAVANLKQSEEGLTMDGIAKMDEKKLDACIAKVGFHNNKTKYIKKAVVMMKEKYGGKVPNTVDGLCSLPGVGPKMAFLVMNVAFDDVQGICVDTHVHRICDRLRWTKNAKTPEMTREQLESWLPKDRWKMINPLLVGFGQTICTPIGPKCDRCLLSSFCPSSTAKGKGR